MWGGGGRGGMLIKSYEVSAADVWEGGRGRWVGGGVGGSNANERTSERLTYLVQ